MKLMNLIRAYRMWNTVSLDALAKEIGIDTCALWRFECGRGVSADKWVKIMTWAISPSEPEGKMRSGEPHTYTPRKKTCKKS